jgi:hypothetical protein
MSKTNLTIVALVIIGASISCKWIPFGKQTGKSDAPVIDFTTPGKSLDVKVQLDEKHTSSGMISPDGGTVSLTSADGSKFTLEVPAKALDTETTITMTAVKTLDGAPLDNNTPSAVQLEPSGLFFNEMVTLTIIPPKEFAGKKQIIFGYEGDGKDYHLTLIDPKSKDVKIKLMEFSGAGVGSGSDAAWAANLQIQAETARTRMQQKIGEFLQIDRMKNLLGYGELDNTEMVNRMKSTFEQYDDQVLRKILVSTELECRFAHRAMQDVLGNERQRTLLGFPGDPNLWQKIDKLAKIKKECKKPAAFQIVGGLDDWQTSTKVCDILQPFTLTGGGFKNEFSGGLSGTYSYSGPFNSKGKGTYTISLPEGLDKPGTMTGRGEGSAEGYGNSGTEKYTLTPLEPCSQK